MATTHRRPIHVRQRSTGSLLAAGHGRLWTAESGWRTMQRLGVVRRLATGMTRRGDVRAIFDTLASSARLE
jgi:hypothetical protein